RRRLFLVARISSFVKPRSSETHARYASRDTNDVSLKRQRRKSRQRSLRNAGQLDDYVVQLLEPFRFYRLEPMPQHRVVGCVQEWLHLGPLGQEGLAHLIAQPSQRAELALKRKLVFPV